jgi:hypothetical protein
MTDLEIKNKVKEMLDIANDKTRKAIERRDRIVRWATERCGKITGPIYGKFNSDVSNLLEKEYKQRRNHGKRGV